MSNLFQIPASINKIETLQDKTLKLTAYCSREIPAEEMAKVFSLNNSEGWLLFSPNTIKTEDVPFEDAKLEKEEKTPSERLYKVMFAYYMQNHKDSTGFNEWRRNNIEKMIQAYKDKLV